MSRARAIAAAAAFALSACTGGCAPPSITPEPPVLRGPAPESQGEKADTFTIEFAPLGFKVAIAVPEGGQFCIILPEKAQDPAACIGLAPDAMIEALPEGPERPFGVGYARMGEWSYIVMLAPTGSGIESREDIDEFLTGALKPAPEAPEIAPRIVPPAPNEKYELIRVKDVPIVKFRLDTPAAPDSPQYEASSALHYAAFGGKAAMVSFLTSPKDMERLMPYAEASIQSLVLPPRHAPELFGKSRSELSGQGMKTAFMILGPLVALGALLFIWLGRSKKDEPVPAPKAAPASKAAAVRKPASPRKAAATGGAKAPAKKETKADAEVEKADAEDVESFEDDDEEEK